MKGNDQAGDSRMACRFSMGFYKRKEKNTGKTFIVHNGKRSQEKNALER